MKSKVIILRGPSGVGKSSVAHLLVDKLKEKIKRLAYLPVDVSIYPFMRTHSKLPREERAEIMQENIESIMNNFLRRGFTIIIDGMFSRKYKNKPTLERLIKIAKKYDVKTLIVELHAHIGILHGRIKERVKKNPYAWKNPKKTESRYKRFMNSRYNNAIVIETENKSQKQVVNEILKKLK